MSARVASSCFNLPSRYPIILPVRSPSSPANTGWCVLEEGPLGQQFIAGSVALGEIASLGRGLTGLDHPFDVFMERSITGGVEIEHWVDFHHRGVQAFSVRRCDAAGVDGCVGVANEGEERAEGPGGVQVVVHGL